MKVSGVIERFPCPSLREFEQQLAGRERPMILTGAIDAWPALRWTRGRIGELLGGAELLVERSSTTLVRPGPRPGAAPDASVMSVRDFLALLEQPREPSQKLIGSAFLPKAGWEALADEIALPSLVVPERLRQVGFMLSPAGGTSALHFDGNGCHNLNAQVLGSKKVYLFAPEQLPNLYPRRLLQGSASWSQIDDIFNVDPVQFPNFREAQCLEGEVRPGELLFIPALWYHTLLHQEETNLNIAFWWNPTHYRVSPALWLLGLDTMLEGLLEGLGPDARALVERLDGVYMTHRAGQQKNAVRELARALRH